MVPVLLRVHLYFVESMCVFSMYKEQKKKAQRENPARAVTEGAMSAAAAPRTRSLGEAPLRAGGPRPPTRAPCRVRGRRPLLSPPAVLGPPFPSASRPGGGGRLLGAGRAPTRPGTRDSGRPAQPLPRPPLAGGLRLPRLGVPSPSLWPRLPPRPTGGPPTAPRGLSRSRSAPPRSPGPEPGPAYGWCGLSYGCFGLSNGWCGPAYGRCGLS